MQIEKQIFYVCYCKSGLGLVLATERSARSEIVLPSEDKCRVILSSTNRIGFPFTLKPSLKEINRRGLMVVSDKNGILK